MSMTPEPTERPTWRVGDLIIPAPWRTTPARLVTLLAAIRARREGLITLAGLAGVLGVYVVAVVAPAVITWVADVMAVLVAMGLLLLVAAAVGSLLDASGGCRCGCAEPRSPRPRRDTHPDDLHD